MCGGHGIACKTVNKIFDEQYSKPGYYDLVLIPSGATNIRITEVRITLFINKGILSWSEWLLSLIELVLLSSETFFPKYSLSLQYTIGLTAGLQRVHRPANPGRFMDI